LQKIIVRYTLPFIVFLYTQLALSQVILPIPYYESSQSCDLNGIITGTIVIKTVALEYSFDDGLTWTTSNTKNNLTQGFYNIKIRNNTQESPASKIYIDTQLVQKPNVAWFSSECYTILGSGIRITISTPAAEYSFDDGVTWTTNNTLYNALAQTKYYIRTRNNPNCISDKTVVETIAQIPSPVAPTILVKQPSCNSYGYGTITVTTPALRYSYDDGYSYTDSPVSPQLLPGTYYVKVIIRLGERCTSDVAIAVLNPPYDAPAAPTVNISQPLNCAHPFGSITITSTAFEYSFDNGATWSKSSNSGNLAPGDYRVKVRDRSSCESLGVLVTINPPTDYPTAPKYTVIQPDCSNNLKGTIVINSMASEYSFDNGITWSVNNTLNYLDAGKYQIKIKNLLGCVSPASEVVIIPFTTFAALPFASSPQTFCIQQNATLNNIAITGQNIQWHTALTGGSLLPNTTALVDGMTYYASQTINACQSERIAVVIKIQNTAAPTGSNQSLCASQNPTLKEIEVTGSNINWYATNGSTSVLPITSPLVDGVTYYATQTINGCESTTRLPITVSLINTLNATDYNAEICDALNDGKEIVNLFSYQGNLIANPDNCTFGYYYSIAGATNQDALDQITGTNYPLTTSVQTIYVRITSSNSCYQIVALQFTLFTKPMIPINDIEPICENANITISAGAGFDSYDWSTGEKTPSITIDKPGDYQVIVTQNHAGVICTSIKKFTVVISNAATIAQIVISDWTTNDNSILVLLTSTSMGDYEYSLDDVTYQDSNIFTGLQSGQYTIYVKDKNGCGDALENVYLLMYPKFFTPNGDGANDLWTIQGSDKEPNLKIDIFDRFGKLLKTLHSDSQGWNGSFNGKALPATDYWFTVIRTDGKEYKGHFALKR
jgi:large repetitive protein